MQFIILTQWPNGRHVNMEDSAPLLTRHSLSDMNTHCMHIPNLQITEIAGSCMLQEVARCWAF